MLLKRQNLAKFKVCRIIVVKRILIDKADGNIAK